MHSHRFVYHTRLINLQLCLAIGCECVFKTQIKCSNYCDSKVGHKQPQSKKGANEVLGVYPKSESSPFKTPRSLINAKGV